MTLIQTVQGNGGGYVNTYTKSITPAAGNFLTVVIAIGATDTCTITDDKSNTWTLNKSQVLTAQRQEQSWSSMNVVGGATTITVTMGASQFSDTAIIIQEWDGVAKISAFDTFAVANTSSGTSYACGPTGTNVQANELLIGGIASDSSTPAFTADATWSNLLTQSGFDLYTSCATQYRIVFATGTYSWTLTNATSRQTSQVITTYKSSGSGTSFRRNNLRPRAFAPGIAR